MAIHDLHPPTMPVNVPTNDVDFYRMPFPNDLRLRADGTVDLSTYPRVTDPGTLVYQYVETFNTDMHGFGENSAIYFRFSGPIDDTTLPADANASVQDGATAFVVDVTQGSPTYGMKTPVQAHFVAVSYDFIGPNWVALLPFPGIPLREKTTYAAILTDGIKDTEGHSVGRDSDLDGALGKSSSDPTMQAAIKAYKPLADWLATQGDLKKHLANATVFTTSDATSLMFALRKNIYDVVPAPTLDNLAYSKEDVAGVNQLYEATYAGPNYQQGTVPYSTMGGQIVVDANGVPMLDHMENSLRLSLSIPEGTMPAAGWPVVIYSHGTGGDYHSYIGDGSGHEAAKVTDANGNVIAQMAMLGTDQVLHGPRDPTGSNPDLTFFNFQNPTGARFNPLQGALDDFQVLRLVKAINVASAPTTGVPIKFDPTKIYFKGHSQGSLTGALYLAAEPEVKAGILSGAGAVLILSLLNKTSPVNIPQLIGGILRDPVDQYHPLLSLLQSYLEQSDPSNYGKYYFREPPDGFAAKSIYQSLGFIDTYAPVPNGKAQALCAGLQPINPMVTGGEMDGLSLVNMTWGNAPTSNNVANMMATGVMLEYVAPAGDDGHFVVFDVPAAVAQSNRFLATAAATGVAQLTAP
jgi:hypothetical protein